MHRPLPQHPLWCDQLERDLADLEKRYTLHCNAFPHNWLDYGELDPIELNPALMFAAKDTGAPPEVTKVDSHQYAVKGVNLGEPMNEWKLMLAWNRSPGAVAPPWQQLPFFFLKDLEALQAKLKLGSIRSHLEMRARLYKMRRMSGQDVGSCFISRLKAYREWSELSQGILREQEPGVFARPNRGSAQEGQRNASPRGA